MPLRPGPLPPSPLPHQRRVPPVVASVAKAATTTVAKERHTRTNFLFMLRAERTQTILPKRTATDQCKTTDCFSHCRTHLISDAPTRVISSCANMCNSVTRTWRWCLNLEDAKRNKIDLPLLQQSAAVGHARTTARFLDLDHIFAHKRTEIWSAVCWDLGVFLPCAVRSPLASPLCTALPSYHLRLRHTNTTKATLFNPSQFTTFTICRERALVFATIWDWDAKRF